MLANKFDNQWAKFFLKKLEISSMIFFKENNVFELKVIIF